MSVEDLAASMRSAEEERATFLAGRLAFRRAGSLASNPHPPDSALRPIFADGFAYEAAAVARTRAWPPGAVACRERAGTHRLIRHHP